MTVLYIHKGEKAGGGRKQMLGVILVIVIIIIMRGHVSTILGRMSGLVVMVMGRSGTRRVVPHVWGPVSSTHSLQLDSLSPLASLRSEVVSFPRTRSGRQVIRMHSTKRKAITILKTVLELLNIIQT